jgi:hypothetical protein
MVSFLFLTFAEEKDRMRTPIETTAAIDLTPRDLDTLGEELRA